ncbi:tail fiber protein [Yersinia phage vB_YenM_P778]
MNMKRFLLAAVVSLGLSFQVGAVMKAPSTQAGYNSDWGSSAVQGIEQAQAQADSAHSMVLDTAGRIAALESAPKPKDGVNGKDGKDGARGLTGAAGTNGADGATGAAGKDGSNGLDGAAGRDGVDGRDGLNGADGKDGISIKGDTGAAGSNGLDGKDGKDGVGINGKDGLNGLDGVNGLNGADGNDTHNDAAVESHTKSLNKQEQRIGDLEQRTNQNFANLKSEVDNNKKRADAGIAGVAAMANIPQVMGSKFTLGAGVGARGSEQAIAVGAKVAFTDSVVGSLGVAADTEQGYTVGAGVGIGFQ